MNGSSKDWRIRRRAVPWPPVWTAGAGIVGAVCAVALVAGLGLSARAGVAPEPGRPGAERASRPALLAGSPGTGAAAAVNAAPAAAAEPRMQASAAYGNLPLGFERNRGQTDGRVDFLARGPGYTLFLTPDEAVLSLRPPGPPAAAGGAADDAGTGTPAGGHPTTDATAGTALRLRLVGANPAPEVAGLEALPGTVNYLLGDDPARWRTNVPTYAQVRYREVYPGIDLVYYGHQGHLEYDFVVAPGADPAAIRLAFAGAAALELDAAGDLVLHTAAGGAVRQRQPLLYQDVAGARQEVAGGYVLLGSQQVGFQVAAYDASRPLVIDPVLVYATYLGGSSWDGGRGIAVDASGHAYVTGETFSTDFPTTPGAFDPAVGGTDAYVTKLSPTGTALVYSTYLGGTGTDQGRRIAVDAAGHAYATGVTQSPDFPTVNAIQPALGGGIGNADAFVAKLTPTGAALVYATYLGGSEPDASSGIAVDAAGHAYATGVTASPDFPTVNALQPTCGNNCANFAADAFVAKLSATGAALVYATYLGGSDGDSGGGIAVDAAGHAYATGVTASPDFPTVNALQPTCGNNCAFGNFDAFVVKLADVPAAGEATGGGTVEVAGGTATFGFSVERRAPGGPVTGKLGYINPAGGPTLASRELTSLTLAGRPATVTGTCVTAAGAPCTFTATVVDGGPAGAGDAFTIAVDGGPPQGGRLDSGDVQVRPRE